MTEIKVPVSVDKPGRAVVISTRSDDSGLPRATLDLEPSFPADHWTWLSAEEARAVARALDEAADELDRPALAAANAPAGATPPGWRNPEPGRCSSGGQLGSVGVGSFIV